MKKSAIFLVILGVIAGFSVPFVMGQDGGDEQKKKAKIGKKAPDFTLKTTGGKKITLSNYWKETEKDKDGKIVILQWINPDCPYCTRVHKDGLVTDMLKNIKKVTKDFVHLEINSTHYMSAEKTAGYLKTHGVDSPALMDNSGEVGKLYGAKTTPHMYVIDRDGVLRYAGAFDNDIRGRKTEQERTNFVLNAVKQIENDKDVSPNKTKPWGCSVKYKKK